MRNKTLQFFVCASALVAAGNLFFVPQSHGQVVGYLNLQMYAGDNLFANQFSDGEGDYLNSDLVNGVLTGSTFTEWNPATSQFSPTSVFNGTSWSINYQLPPDETGAVLNSPGSTTITLAGGINYPYNPQTDSFSYTPPTRPGGTYLLGYAIPINGATFEDIVGRAPLNGESVRTLDATTQTYSTTTFENGSWDNGTPSFSPGEAGYLTLAPEPSIYAIAGVGTALLLTLRCRLKLLKV